MFPQLIRSTWHSVYGHVSGMLPLELRQKPSPDGLTVTWTRRKEKKKRSFWHWPLPWKAVSSIEMRLLLHFNILNYKVFLLVCVCAPPNLNCTQICLKNEIWHYDFSSHLAALPSNPCMQPLRLRKHTKNKTACMFARSNNGKPDNNVVGVVYNKCV